MAKEDIGDARVGSDTQPEAVVTSYTRTTQATFHDLASVPSIARWSTTTVAVPDLPAKVLVNALFFAQRGGRTHGSVVLG